MNKPPAILSPGSLVVGLLVAGVEHVQPALDLLRRVAQAPALPALMAASLLPTALPAAELLVPARCLPGAVHPAELLPGAVLLPGALLSSELLHPKLYGCLMLGREHPPVREAGRVKKQKSKCKLFPNWP